MRRPLAVVAEARAEQMSGVWRAACDRVAMGLIHADPDPDHRAASVTLYRELCQIEEKRSAKAAVEQP
jgi:hypothetical protein